MYHLLLVSTSTTDACYSDSFPSSVAFDAINDALSSDEAERKQAIKQGGAVFSFKLTNSSKKEEAWYIDLKETGKVGKGEAPESKKADGKCFVPAIEGKTTRLMGASNTHPFGRELWQVDCWQTESTDTVHERQAKGQGQCHER